MSLLEESQFKVTVRSNRPSVSVLYKPTRRRYTYSAVPDQTERSQATGFCVDRIGNFGNYDDSEIQRHARSLALAMAKKIFRRSAGDATSGLS